MFILFVYLFARIFEDVINAYFVQLYIFSPEQIAQLQPSN